MDDYAEKRLAGGLEFSKRSSGLSFRDPKNEERNLHFCNRTGCSTRHNSTKITQSSSSEKLKYLKPPLRFKSSDPNAASSSRSFSSSSNLNISFHERLNAESLEEANIAECSKGQGEDEDGLKFDLEFHGRNKETEYSRRLKPQILHSFPTSSTKMLSSPKATSASRYGKQISQSSGRATQDNANPPFRQSSVPRIATQDNANPPFRQSSVPRIASQIPKSTQCAISRPQRYGLKNLGCASISDALPSGSSSDGHNKRAVSLRKKFHDGEGSSNGGMPSLQEKQVSEDSSRTKIQYNSKDVTGSVIMFPRSGGVSNRMKSNEQEDEHSFQLPEPILFPTRSHAPLTISEVVQERSPLPFVFQNTSFAGRPRSSSRSSRCRSVSNSEDGDGLRLNIEGIAEVLQALERIEQEEELTYEQLMVLEANLLEGFSFYDQHRDMRLDIDNMSYEDLLALEEKMGSVSTAVPEDALSKCLKKSTYRTGFLHMPVISVHGDDDIKCSICQEEYMIGEEVGRLQCNHHYHMACIQQWLTLKNWCPICKSSSLALLEKDE